MKYTEQQLAFIKENSKLPRIELTELFNEAFGENKGAKAIGGLCKRYGWLTDKKYWNFSKGNIAWNKGVTGYMGANKTSFKKGLVPHNYRPVGSERITKDGYIEVKIKDPKTWRLKHIHVWEQVNGKLPTGHCIIFNDSNRKNCDLSNLQLITREENARFNKSGYSHYPQELKPTLRVITKLDITAKQLSSQ
ncbi:HNH endonuclease [Orbus hercynius]|uniref:HNH endonuclease n=1 Tax=Orbus hercynius TaxID=593135 RepID=A0A495RIC5_9GAMM|nr:HNH endonuclease signature motif containing protein [Orbus hercynius]RKS87293.1 HNH endonuclease [Orbus hercynius]